MAGLGFVIELTFLRGREKLHELRCVLVAAVLIVRSCSVFCQTESRFAGPAKRPDGYHELRTIFQTISLKDRLSVEYKIAKRTQIDVTSSIDIEDNLVVRSAKMVLDHLKLTAWVRFLIHKRIPMGAGLGGGSSNAAAVLIALPALAGKPISFPDLVRLAESLGSDVPFFLHGGTALGLGRGTELYPLPDLPRARSWW